MSDTTNVKMRVNFLTLNGEFLISTDWSTNRAAIVHVADTTNAGGKMYASVESTASGYADVGDGINSH